MYETTNIKFQVTTDLRCMTSQMNEDLKDKIYMVFGKD
jgi:hypothetical protein